MSRCPQCCHALALHQGLCIDEAEAIDLVLVRPMVQGVQNELPHHSMPTVQHSIVAVVGGCIQAPQRGGLGPFVSAFTGEAVLYLDVQITMRLVCVQKLGSNAGSTETRSTEGQCKVVARHAGLM